MSTTPQPTPQPNVRHYNAQDKARLTDLINEGCVVFQEIDDLKNGFNDTIKALAEELDVKPSQLKKAVRIAYKNSLQEERDNFEEVEDILDTVGKGNT